MDTNNNVQMLSYVDSPNFYGARRHWVPATPQRDAGLPKLSGISDRSDGQLTAVRRRDAVSTD